MTLCLGGKILNQVYDGDSPDNRNQRYIHPPWAGRSMDIGVIGKGQRAVKEQIVKTSNQRSKQISSATGNEAGE